MDNNGWIKLHRKFTEWEWYCEDNMVRLFIHFLILANHDENKWRGQIIRRGQFITGLDSLSQNTGISVQSLRTCIDRLKSTGEITNFSTNQYRLITIVKYDDYQIDNKKQQAKQQAIQQTTNKQLTANKNDKNIKNNTNTSKNEFLQGVQISYLIDLFQEINPMYRDFYRNTTERKALDDLARQISFDKLEATIKELPKILGQPFAPKVSKPSELRRDLGKLLIFVKQKKSETIKKTTPNFII